jgi:hypothetical protein
MNYFIRLTSAVLGLLLLVGLTAKIARADDGVFPPSPDATPYINFDGRGFLLKPWIGPSTSRVIGPMAER